MTVSTTGNRVTHNGDASTTAFAYNKTHLLSSDLDVFVDGTQVTENGAGTYDFTVSPTTGGTSATITFNNAPVVGTENIVIINNPPQTQVDDYKTAGKIPAQQLEKNLDKITMLIQQLQDDVNQKVGFAVTSSDTGELPDFPSTQQALVGDSTAGFAFAALSSFPTAVTITETGLAANDFLQYNGAAYVNKTPQETAEALEGSTWDFTGANTHAGINSHTAQVRWAKGADVASANALTLGTDGNYFDITGTTAITSIGTLGIGTVVKLHFDGALTLTHHATDLILPGGANITTAAGDEAEFVEYATGDWRCTNYTKATGHAVVSDGLVLLGTYSASADTSVDIGSGLDLDAAIDSTYDEYLISFIDVVPETDANILYLRAGNGGTFDSGATDYQYAQSGQASAAAGAGDSESTGDTEIPLNLVVSVGSAAGETMSGWVRVYSPAGTNHTLFSYFVTGLTGATNVFNTFGTGVRSEAAAHDRLRFLFATGNITSGTFYLYGVTKS